MMNRRSFLAALGVAPVVAAGCAVAAKETSPNEYLSLRAANVGDYSPLGDRFFERDGGLYKVDARGVQETVAAEVQKAIAEYDRKLLPYRIKQIASDPRRRA